MRQTENGGSNCESSTAPLQSGSSDTKLKNCVEDAEVSRLTGPGQEIGTIGRREVEGETVQGESLGL